jgi:hypothetical protein
MVEFKARIAGRFHAEFLFYLAVFLLSLYAYPLTLKNPWIVVLAVLSGLLAIDLFWQIWKNTLACSTWFVKIDSDKITVADKSGTQSVKWKEIEFVKAAEVSREKWLEFFFGVEPSLLFKKKRSAQGEFELGISPDFIPTRQVLSFLIQTNKKVVY